MSFLEFLLDQREQIVTLTGEHLFLVATSTAIALAAGRPLGVMSARRRALARPILGVTNVLQTIPSLALFGFLIPLPFLGGIAGRSAGGDGGPPSGSRGAGARLRRAIVRRRALWTALAALVALLLSSCWGSRGDRIVVGAKNFTEQAILGEIVATLIERRTP